MLSKDWKQLQNGSDIRGTAMEGVAGQPTNLTGHVVERIAAAFTGWLVEKKIKPVKDLTISIGMDSRLSGPALKDASVKGVISLGCRAADLGMASTPAMFMSIVTKDYEYDGAIMITASHLPYNRNGMKFFTNEGGLDKKDITDILKAAQEDAYKKASTPGEVLNVDFMSVYAENLVKLVRESVNHPDHWSEPLQGLKIIVDAGNGAGGFFAHKVLMPLGADIEGSQFLEPDGTFPNHIPNPEDNEAVKSLRIAVLENNADLGIIFDADVDRAGAVVADGSEINRNRLVALLSAIVLEEHPSSVVVTDSITSSGLKTFIEENLGGVHHRFRRGYRNVINEAVRLNSEGRECWLAIETSGHGALKENYFLDDGAYLVTKILIKMAKLRLESGKNIGSLIAGLKEPVEGKEFRMGLKTDEFIEYGNRIIHDLKDYAAQSAGWKVAPHNYEGIRVSFDKADGDGWFLLRISLHDPLMPLNIESDTVGGIKTITSCLIPFLKKYSNLDIKALEEYMENNPHCLAKTKTGQC